MLLAGNNRKSRQVYTPGNLTDFYLYETGEASWYGPGFQGRPTASGETFDTRLYTMAHKTLPLGEVVCVRSLVNNELVLARVTDRGPYIKGRIADLSYKAMIKLGLVGRGHGRVEIYRTADAFASR